MEIGDRIIAVVHEPYWQLPTGTFCTLKPIADIAGDEIDPTEFYNRGKIWWKLRSEDLSYSSIGRIIVVGVENAPSFDKTDPDKDCYQVETGTVMGAESYIAEIVEMDSSISQSALIETGRLLSDHPIRGVVFARSGSYVLGPFSSSGCDQIEQGRNMVYLNLAPGWGSHPLRQMEWGEFAKLAQPRTLSLNIYTEPHERGAVEIEYSFFPKERLDRMLASQIGSPIDHRSDQVVVSEVVKDLKWLRADRQALKRLIEDIHRSDPNLDRVQKNKERILKIVRKVEGNENLIREMIDTLLEEERFHSQLEKRINERVSEHIEKSRIELERQAVERIRDKKEELSELEKTFDDLNALIEAEQKRSIQECEREIKRKRDELEEHFRNREEELTRRDNEFLGRQKSLSKLVTQLSQNRDEMVAQLVGLMPILQEMGFRTQADKREEPTLVEKTQEPTAVTDICSYTPLQGVAKSLPEKEFIDRWIKWVSDNGFSYGEKDLRNFHVCTKSENFNVLTGLSGIGKSSLPRFYAQALHGNVPGDMRFLMVAVQPGWLDSHELLGHFNSLEGRFQPSSCGLYRFLVSAAREASEPDSGVYLCCLDEMNLSHVEHYFADFLSMLQAPIQDRRLRLFDGNLCRSDDPYRNYYEVQIPRSLRFCGTVNVDETTKFFSPKVLDRVHIIEIAPVALSNVNSWHEQQPDSTFLGDPVSERVFRSWFKDPGLVQEYVLRITNDLDDHLARVGLRISPRTFKSICRYVSNARDVMESDEEAMDFAIFQRLLPGLRGHSPQFRDWLYRLIEICEARKYTKSSFRIRLIAEAQVAMDFFNYSLV